MRDDFLHVCFKLPLLVGCMLLFLGKHYYEATIGSSDAMSSQPAVAQIGWADELFVANCTTGAGTGDDEHSWGYDGARQKKWHKSSCEAFGTEWQRGDVIGCALDIDAREVWTMDGK